MKFEETQFGQYPLKDMRDALRRFRGGSFEIERGARIFAHAGVGGTWDEFFRTALKNQLLERSPERRRGSDGKVLKSYRVSKRGISLSVSRMTPRMNRERIERLYQETMSRIEEIDTDPRFVRRFALVVVYGSYLDQTKADYGDLDICYRLENKPEWRGNSQESFDRMDDHHLGHFPSDADMYGSRISSRHLKYVRNRDPRISLVEEALFNSMCHREGKLVPHRVVRGDFDPDGWKRIGRKLT